jgi:hypothetical protein
MIISHQGKVVLHASAVQFNSGAIVFAGPSGAGKSTLAISLSLQGGSMLADECFPLEASGDEIVGLPSYLGGRLWPDSLEALFPDSPLTVTQPTKHLVLSQQQSNSSNPSRVPIHALCFLEAKDAYSGAASLSSLSQRDAMMQIIRNSFQLDPTDQGSLTRLFSEASRIASVLPTFRLAYEHEYGILPGVQHLIEERLQRPVSGNPSIN